MESMISERDLEKQNMPTSKGNPFSVVRCLFMKPLITTVIPSAVSRVNTSYLLIIGADENTRTARCLQHAKEN